MRTYLFIDGSNIYHAMKNVFQSAKIDFYKLGNQICSALGPDYKCTRIYYYNVPIDQARDPAKYKAQQQFIDSLKRTPFLNIHLGRLEYRNGVPVEKGVDVKIAVDMLAMAARELYEAAVLISGDADFVPVLKTIKEQYRQEVFVAYPHEQCYHIKAEADKFVLIDRNMFLASQ